MRSDADILEDVVALLEDLATTAAPDQAQRYRKAAAICRSDVADKLRSEILTVLLQRAGGMVMVTRDELRAAHQSGLAATIEGTGDGRPLIVELVRPQ